MSQFYDCFILVQRLCVPRSPRSRLPSVCCWASHDGWFVIVFLQSLCSHSVARSLLYSVILCFRAHSLQFSLWISDCALKYKARFWISSEVVYLQRYSMVVIWLVQCENVAISAHVLGTPYNRAPDYSVIRIHILHLGPCVSACMKRR